MTFLEEVQRRRTFAIISHPDAGKTTLTEKLLLYGGAIHLAGSVKSRKTAKHAVSDWMEIEKQRGISVTSSVLQFDYDGCRVNILDTPGHQDFSEDTYRTLMAADSAVMLIDVAKGVEAQTKKLFAVSKERGIPIFTFVNKIDHFGRSPFDLMEEIENVLGIRTCPMNWPIGINGEYKGVYDREHETIELFAKDETHGQEKLASEKGALTDPRMKEFGAELVEVAAIEDRPQAMTAAGEVMALDWGITLQCDTTGKEDASSVGVRSHFIHPVLPEADGTTKNVFPCKVERVIEDVFSYILIVSTKEEARIRVDVTKEQWQQYQKHISGNKIWIGIDEKDVMLLK